MQDSKQQILKTAFSLFLKKSFKEVTMKEIVNETKLSKGAVYHYFESKEQLFREVVNTFYFEKMIINYNHFSQNSLWEFYHDYAAYIKKVFFESKEELNHSDSNININYITIMFDALKLFPDFQDKTMQAQQTEFCAWLTIITSARAKREFNSQMTDEQIAKMFIYTNDGIGLHFLLEGKVSEAHTAMLDLWDSLYNELKN